MVFGVFDRLHPGHISFLAQAAGYGDKLIVVVARDAMVRQLKKKTSFHEEKKRMRAIKDISCEYAVVLGDTDLGSYNIIRSHQPDRICLGYDQHALAEDLRLRMAQGEFKSIELVVMQSHEAEKFHTSLLTTSE